MRHSAEDALVAGAVAAIVSGAPSTVHALATRRDPVEAALAAGALLAPWARSRGALLAAAVPVHLALSLGWAAVLAPVLPHGREVAAGAAAGVAIAALDLGVVGRRHSRIRGLPLAPQVFDHLTFGAAVGAVVAHGRRRRTWT